MVSFAFPRKEKNAMSRLCKLAIVSQCLVTGFENKLLWDLVPVSCFPCSISQATDCNSRLESPWAPLFLPDRAKYAARGQNPPLPATSRSPLLSTCQSTGEQCHAGHKTR